MPVLSPPVSVGRKSGLQRFLGRIIEKRTFHQSDPSLDGLSYWRERILAAVLTAGGGLSLLALVPAIFLALARQLWILLIADGVALLLVGYLLLVSRRELRFRAMVTLSVTFMVGVIIIHQIGFLSGGTAWLVLLFGPVRGLAGTKSRRHGNPVEWGGLCGARRVRQSRPLPRTGLLKVLEPFLYGGDQFSLFKRGVGGLGG